MTNLGYVHNPREIERIAVIRGTLAQTVRSNFAGSGAGRDVFLYDIERALTGSVRPPHNQAIGSCTSQGSTGGAEDLQFVEIAADLKSRGLELNPASYAVASAKFQSLATEVTYGLARHQVGRDAMGMDYDGNNGGAVVAWAIQSMLQYGVLPRGVYGQYDLSTYNARTDLNFGNMGCPQALLDVTSKHKVKDARLITGPNLYTQARDVIANLGVIVTGSNQLYSDTRDANGFCRPSGNGGHCTYYRAVTDNAVRPGIGYQQSWGPSTPKGPTRVTLPHGPVVDLPAGFFFIDAENFERMHSQQAEVWAITLVDQFVRPDVEIPFRFF